MAPKVTGVHLVGSIPLSSTEEVLRSVCAALPDRLKCIPDGETGDRDNFVYWQVNLSAFKRQPVLLHEMFNPEGPTTFSDDEADKIIKDAGEVDTWYDKAALESYPIFKRLKDEGVIAKGVRFLVALPTPVALVAGFVRHGLQARFETVLEAGLLRALSNIQKEIPADELAIQWDAPLEFGLLEGIERLTPGLTVEPWFSPTFEGVVERLVRIGEAVDEKVEMGYHFCYGRFLHVGIS